MEQSFVAEWLIEQAKQLFVRTVNDAHSMQRFLKYDVDGIITNYPNKASHLR